MSRGALVGPEMVRRRRNGAVFGCGAVLGSGAGLGRSFVRLCALGGAVGVVVAVAVAVGARVITVYFGMGACVRVYDVHVS